jgi:hypothetical protein
MSRLPIASANCRIKCHLPVLTSSTAGDDVNLKLNLALQGTDELSHDVGFSPFRQCGIGFEYFEFLFGNFYVELLECHNRDPMWYTTDVSYNLGLCVRTTES